MWGGGIGHGIDDLTKKLMIEQVESSISHFSSDSIIGIPKGAFDTDKQTVFDSNAKDQPIGIVCATTQDLYIRMCQIIKDGMVRIILHYYGSVEIA